jgi:glycosyltransferase involved in cell wall biosynthesis
LVLSFYYEPDLCAGSFRTTALVAVLRERAPFRTQIDVLTTLPNRYGTFSHVAAELDAEFSDRLLAWFTNGIDEEFLVAAGAASTRAVGDPCTVVLYAGNIGESQGLHEVLPRLAIALRERARFIVIGDGGRRAALAAAIAAAGVDNIELLAPRPRAELPSAYRAADVLFLHLGRLAAFENVLPSKLFERAALAKPILAGVAGYAARFVHEEISNAAVFGPCDVPAAVIAFGSLQLTGRPRPDFVGKYARTQIARAMADDVLAVVRNRI